MDNKNEIKVRSLLPDIMLFIFGSLLMLFIIYYLIPMLRFTGIMDLGLWMMLTIPLLFLPILIGIMLILKTEKTNLKLSERFRFRRMIKSDWLYCLAGFVFMAAGSTILFIICNFFEIDTNSPFTKNVEVWTDGHYWMFALWAIYWPINIMVESIAWHGVILSRMEAKIGRYAWILNGLMWGVFHIGLGAGGLIVLIPTLIVVPLIAQKTKNTWTAVILHACLSGPSYFAFGLM